MELPNLERRVDDLESRLAFMQITLEEINSVVVKQANTIDQLEMRLKGALLQLRAGGNSKDSDPPGDETPPHY